jgi:hypothetical protein
VELANELGKFDKAEQMQEMIEHNKFLQKEMQLHYQIEEEKVNEDKVSKSKLKKMKK